MSSEDHSYFVQWHFHKLNSSTFFHSNSQSLYLLLWFFAILVFVPSLFLCINFCPAVDSHSKKAPLQLQWSLLYLIVNGWELSSQTTVWSHLQLAWLVQILRRRNMLRECEHVFHSECLDMWLSAHPSCPLCRASLHHSQNLKK
ncbi:RING-H2 finger protein ATL63, partial [Mucuna pruriens]